MLNKDKNNHAPADLTEGTQTISTLSSKVDLTHIDTWVFDLDNTLYSWELDLFAQVDQKMGEFIGRQLQLPSKQAKALQKEYYRTYGTTLRGLMLKHGLDPEPFLEYVHNIDLGSVEKDRELNALLSELPGRKLVFTNGSLGHAERVTAALGIDHHFESIFDVSAAGYVPKHESEVFDDFCEHAELIPQSSVMFDDISLNLLHPHASGMTTVLVRTEIDWSAQSELTDGNDHIHHETDDLVEFLRRIEHSLSIARSAAGPECDVED